MKIHITGMSPRMVSHRARAKISFASLLADALTASGHDVVRDAAHHEDADAVIIGVSSALSPAATYSIVALGLLARAVKSDTPVLLLVDDPELGKTRDSIASVRRDPDRLWSDFLIPKRVLASSAYSRDEVMTGVEILGQQEWPTVLAPMHAWGRSSGLSKSLRIFSDVVPIDISPVLDIQLRALQYDRPERDAVMWMCEQAYVRGGLATNRTRWPVMRMRNDPTWSTVHAYGGARAIYQAAGSSPGWWTPTPLFAIRAGSLYVPELEEGVLMGAPYYYTVDDIEAMRYDQHQVLVAKQHEQFREKSWDLSTLTSSLADVLGQSSSSPTPVTTPTAP